MRAEASGRAFREAFERSVGIGAAPATSQGATFSALEEQVRRQEEIESARRAQTAASAQQGISDAFGIGRALPSARQSADVFIEAARAEEEMAAKATLLRAQIDPLGAATGRLNAEIEEYRTLAAAGAISTAEFEAASGLAQRRFNMTAKGIEASGKVSGFAGHQLQNLSFQLNDVATMALSGASAFQILATQGGQVFQILTMAEGGVLAGLKSLAVGAWGFVTPLTVAGAAATAFGVYSAVAFARAQKSAKQLEDSLQGLGRLSGTTVAEAEQAAQRVAAGGHVSANVARERMAAFLSTGKISSGLAESFSDDTVDAFAKVTGQELPAALDDLKRAFADPTKGAQDLNDKLAFLDDAALQNIRHLAAMGDTSGAAAVMQQRLSASLAGAVDKLREQETWWDRLKKSIGNATDAYGRWLAGYGSVANTATDETDRTLIGTARGRIDFRARHPIIGSLYGDDASDQAMIADAEERIRKRREAANKSAQEAADQKAIAAGETARGIAPSAANYQDLIAKQEQLKQSIDDPAIARGAKSLDVNREALAKVTAAINSYLDPAEKARRLRELDLQAINAVTPAQRAEIEAERARVDAAGDIERALYAEADAKAASARVYAEANKAIADSEHERSIATTERFQGAQLELQSIGQSAQETEKLRYVMEQTNALRREAYQLTGDRHAFDSQIAGLNDEAEAWARLQQQIRQATLTHNCTNASHCYS